MPGQHGRVWRRPIVVGLCVATLAGVWWGRCATTNEERAYFVTDGQVFRVEMTGWRLPMVHDPISLLLNRTRPETFSMELPRIEGIIDGTEVRRADGPPCVGRVVITRLTMDVDLYYVDDGQRRPLAWNGTYKLIQKDAAATR